MTSGVRRFTIVRNGTIKRGRRGAHYCGWAKKSVYPYRVTLTVRGELRGPDYFVVANEELDAWVQAHFAAKRETESCEKMCDDIIDVVLAGMKAYEHWDVEKLHVELTGTAGLALLSCDWEKGDAR